MFLKSIESNLIVAESWNIYSWIRWDSISFHFIFTHGIFKLFHVQNNLVLIFFFLSFFKEEILFYFFFFQLSDSIQFNWILTYLIQVKIQFLKLDTIYFKWFTTLIWWNGERKFFFFFESFWIKHLYLRKEEKKSFLDWIFFDSLSLEISKYKSL